MKVKDLIEELQKHDGEAVVAFMYKTSLSNGKITISEEIIQLESFPSREILAISVDKVASDIKADILDKQLAALSERIIGVIRV